MARLPLVMLGIATWAGAAGAQERGRIPLVVDFIGEEGLYLAAGTAQGLLAGDTLVVFQTPDSDAEPVGRLLIVTTSRRRSVASMIPPEFNVERGTTLYTTPPDRFVETESPVRPREPLSADSIRTADVPPSARTGQRGRTRNASTRVPKVRGRLTMDVDARETRTSWAGTTSGESVRRFITPTTRLTLNASDLPGGWTLKANVRGSYRYSDTDVFTTPQSFRFYSLSMAKTLENAPVHIRLGRFSNPFERYSSYWDGALVRVGKSTGPGVGVAVGFEPNRYDEGISTSRPKVTAFANYSGRRRGLRYSTDMSVHLIRPSEETLLDRTFMGWSQRVTIKRLTLDQRLQFDRRPDTSEWTMSRLRLRGTLRLSNRVHLRAGVGRSQPSYLRPASLLVEGARRDQENLGLTVMGSRGQFSLDLGATERQGRDRGVSISGSGSVRAGEISLYASGRRWRQGENSSISVVPGVGYSWRKVRLRLGYQLYRTTGLVTRTSESAELTISAPILRGLHATLRAQQQWGENYAGTRLRMSLARSF